MAKKLARKMQLIRPADAFLPLALLGGAIFGTPAMAFEYFFNYYVIRLLALATAPGLRIAFALQPSLQKVQGSVTSAVLMQTLGAALCDIGWVIYGNLTGNIPSTLAILVGFLLNIEHVFYEYLHAAGDSHSSVMCHALMSIFLLAGFILSRGWIIALLAFIGMTVAIIISLTTIGPLKGEPNAQVFRSAPRAMLQAAAYIAPSFAALFLFRHIGRWADAPLTSVAPFFAGWAVYSLCQSPFRRSALEARRFMPVLLVLMGLAALLNVVPIHMMFPETVCVYIRSTGAAVGIAALAALILYGNFRRREA